jgi:hypothetical protein
LLLAPVEVLEHMALLVRMVQIQEFLAHHHFQQYGQRAAVAVLPVVRVAAMDKVVVLAAAVIRAVLPV